MLLETLIAVAIGILCGTFTGLIPGFHVNLITAIVVSSAAAIASADPVLLAVFILSLALTHSFLDSVPSIYLGAPDSDQVLTVLPGHQMLLDGKGHHAVVYTLVGSFAALILTIIFFPVGLKFLKPAQAFIEPFIGKVLLAIIIFLLIMSKRFLLNASFFLTAGLLGLLCFKLVSQEHILLPLLSGLFGMSTLLLSLNTSSQLPSQERPKSIPLSFGNIENTVSRATGVGMVASFLPGFGASQAAIVASATMKRKTPRDYLLLVGGINTVNFAFSLITITLLDKARNGAVLGMSNLLETIKIAHLHIFAPVLLLTGGVAVLLGLFLSKRMSRLLQKVDYHKLVTGVILFLISIVILLSGLQGLLILLTATSLGILASQYGAQKNMLLGCLILPVIVYLW